MDKLKIKEAIVVEGRDDSAALRQAVDAFIIETHGFGISRRTWELLARAYEEKGLIIMTDPDFAGEEIRKRISARFPASKHVYMPRRVATRKGDIGVENAAPEDIVRLAKWPTPGTKGGTSLRRRTLTGPDLPAALAPASGGRRWEKRWASAMPTAAVF